MNHVITVTLLPSEEQYLADQAQAAGMPISAYIRSCAMEGTDRWEELLQSELTRATEVCRCAELGITLHVAICRELGNNPPDAARDALVSTAKLLQIAYARGRDTQGLIWRTELPSGNGKAPKNAQIKVACNDTVYYSFSLAAARRNIKPAPHVRQMCLWIAHLKDPQYKDPIKHHGQYLVRCMDAVEEQFRTAERAGWRASNRSQLSAICTAIRESAHMMKGV